MYCCHTFPHSIILCAVSSNPKTNLYWFLATCASPAPYCQPDPAAHDLPPSPGATVTQSTVRSICQQLSTFSKAVFKMGWCWMCQEWVLRNIFSSQIPPLCLPNTPLDGSLGLQATASICVLISLADAFAYLHAVLLSMFFSLSLNVYSHYLISCPCCLMFFFLSLFPFLILRHTLKLYFFVLLWCIYTSVLLQLNTCTLIYSPTLKKTF